MLKFLLLLLGLLTALNASAESPRNIQMLEDHSKQVGIEQLLAAEGSLPWKPATNHENIGYSSSRHWVKFELPESMAPYFPALVINHIYLEKINLYTVVNGRVVHHVRQGMGVPVLSPPIAPFVTGAFYLPLHISQSRQPATYYMSIEGDFPLAVSLKITNGRAFFMTQTYRNLRLGAFFGCLIIAFFYNAFIAASIRSKLYAFYCLFVGSIIMLMTGHERLSVQLLWPQSPWWATVEMHVFGGLAILFYTLFIRSFLETKRRTPFLDKVLLFFAALSTIRAVWLLLEANILVGVIGEIGVMGVNFMALVIGTIYVIRGVREAIFFLGASFAFNVGSLLYVSHTADVIQVGEWVHYAPQVGILAEVLLLSFALADRIRQTDRTLQKRQIEIINSEKMAALGRMAACIAHEVNNPLTIIYANASKLETLSERGNFTSERVREIGQSIERTVLRISQVIKSMRNLSRDSAEDPLMSVPLQDIFQDVIALSSERFRTGQIDFQYRPVDQKVYVLSRSPEICQVLINLLNNAYDAVQNVEKKEIALDWQIEGDQVYISITDSGPGVPEEIRSQIYEPFFTSKEIGKGTGLGLSISKSLIEKHGGHLWLDTTSEKTKFVFNLPLAPLKAMSQTLDHIKTADL